MDLTSLNKYLKVQIVPELENARPGWDKPHTLAVVHYINKILDNCNDKYGLDRYVLIIAAYAHDWGYADLFEDNKKLEIEDVYNKKTAHMEIGAEKVENLLTERVFDFLDNQQKEKITFLVKKHDSYDEISDSDHELRVLVEADTLGALDYDLVKPTFERRSFLKFLSEIDNYRYPLFLTNYSKRKYQNLVRKAKKYYDEM